MTGKTLTWYILRGCRKLPASTAGFCWTKAATDSLLQELFRFSVGRGSDNLAGIMPGKLPTTSVRNMSVIFFLRTSRAG